jgi:hypothetical protein
MPATPLHRIVATACRRAREADENFQGHVMNDILRHHILLDLIERLDGVRDILGRADVDHDVIVHLLTLADNALREAANFLARLREEGLGL